MGDEDDREPELALQVAQQVEDLRLDRDVERGDGLVGDDQLRLQRERPRDADALALAAGELVRVAVVVLGVQARRGPSAPARRACARPRRSAAVDGERVGDDRADRLARVQRRVGVLEDHLHLAAQGLQRSPRRRAMSSPVEADRAAGRARAGAGSGARSCSCRSRSRRRAERLAAPHVEARRRRPRARRRPGVWKMMPCVSGKCLTRSRTSTSGVGHAGRAHPSSPRSLASGLASSGVVPGTQLGPERAGASAGSSRHATTWPASSGTAASRRLDLGGGASRTYGQRG